MKNTMRNNEKPEVQQQPQPERQKLTLEQVDIRLKRVENMLFNQGI